MTSAASPKRCVIANIVNNVVVSSGTQGVSRAVAGAKGHEQEALRAALRVHVPLAVVGAAVMAAAAPVYARFERAEDVIAPLLVLAGVALLYGLYAPLIGYLNGRNRFGRQAALDVTFAVLRTAGLVGVGYAFAHHGLSGVLGTTVGWVAAAAFIIPLAARSTGLGEGVRPGQPRPEGVPSGASYLAMLGPIAGAQLCTNVLLQVDIFLLGRFLSERALTFGVTEGAGRASVKGWLAIYKECQTFAFLPYQLLFSVTLILFPMLVRARADNDQAAVRAYVARGARLAAIFCGLLVGVVVAMPESMLSFAYGAGDAARGADVLRIMALAQAAFAMLGIATTVLTSLGRERTAALLTLAAVIAVAGACAAFVPSAEFGHTQLVRFRTSLQRRARRHVGGRREHRASPDGNVRPRGDRRSHLPRPRRVRRDGVRHPASGTARHTFARAGGRCNLRGAAHRHARDWTGRLGHDEGPLFAQSEVRRPMLAFRAFTPRPSVARAETGRPPGSGTRH